MIHLRVTVPLSSAGGWLGSVHIFSVNVQSPISGWSFLCSGPGFPDSASDLSTASGVGVVLPSVLLALTSSAQLKLAGKASTRADIVVRQIVLTIGLISFSVVPRCLMTLLDLLEGSPHG